MASSSILNRRYGWKPDLPDQRDYKLALTAIALPLEIDLRAQCPAVYDQGQLGSCTANAVAAHLDFNRHKQGEDFIAPSRLFIYYNERKDDGDINSDAGSSIRESVKAVKNYGACPESEWPYVISKFAHVPSPQCYIDALNSEALSYLRVTKSATAIKQCLASGFPLVVGISVYQSFEGAQPAKTGVIPTPSSSESLLGGHAILIVGYKLINKKVYWVFRNSWGTGWGDGGYGYLPQSYLTGKLGSDYWTLRQVK